MSASAKDLPDADLDKIIRDKHRQAQTSRPQMGLSAEPGLNPHRMTDDPPLRRADPLGPTLTVDPADRVYAAGGASRGQGRLGMVIIALVAAALIGGFFLWSQRGSDVAAVAPSPVSTPVTTPGPVDAASSNATVTAPAVQPTATAAPTVTAPIPTAAPVVAAPAAADANKMSAPAATEKTSPEKATTEKATTEKATAEKAATQKSTPQKSTTEKKVEKPAAAPATTEKKKKKAAEPTTATAKPKPAATDSSDENFSTLLKSLTNEDAATPSPSEPAVQQPVTQPAATQPATTQKSGAPLPSSTAPSTPGSQLFTP